MKCKENNKLEDGEKVFVGKAYYYTIDCYNYQPEADEEYCVYSYENELEHLWGEYVVPHEDTLSWLSAETPETIEEYIMKEYSHIGDTILLQITPRRGWCGVYNEEENIAETNEYGEQVMGGSEYLLKNHKLFEEAYDTEKDEFVWKQVKK